MINRPVKVSIITPSFNQGVFVRRTIESVLAQRSDTYALEHLVFDGGSTDETCSVLRSFGDNIRWVSEPDRGQAHAVNKGLAASAGEIIGWLNSDDIYYPGAVAAVVAFFEANPQIDVVYGLADHIDLQDRAFEDYPTEEFDLERMKQTCTICQPSLFFRKHIVAQHGMLDENLHYCMDYEYWLRLGKAGVSFALMPQKLAGSRMYADNKTLGARVKVHREINDMFKRLFGTVPDRWISNYAHAWVENKYNRQKSPLFRFSLVAATVAASIRWNHKVSRPLLALVGQWLRPVQG